MTARRDQFVDRLTRILGVPADALPDLLAGGPRRSALRVNRLAVDDPPALMHELECAGFATRPIPWCPDAYDFDGTSHDLAQTDAFRRGAVYIQNASSLVPVLALDPWPGARVLDACAAPGGKAAHIASVVRNECALWLNDAIAPRLDKLREVMELHRVRYEQLTAYPAQYLDKYVADSFDLILVDAQCTGESRINLRRRDGLQHWSPERVRRYGFLQRKMLAAAWALLRPGGRLVYSTCTFGPEENEEPVDHLLRHQDDAAVETIPLDIPGVRHGMRSWEGRTYHPSLGNAIRIPPGGDMEGFFVARIAKRDQPKS